MSDHLKCRAENPRRIADPGEIDRRIRAWVEAMDAEEARLMAQWQREAGPDGDIREAYKKWFERQSAEKEEYWREYGIRLYRAGVRHGQPRWTSPESE